MDAPRRKDKKRRASMDLPKLFQLVNPYETTNTAIKFLRRITVEGFVARPAVTSQQEAQGHQQYSMAERPAFKVNREQLIASWPAFLVDEDSDSDWSDDDEDDVSIGDSPAGKVQLCRNPSGEGQDEETTTCEGCTSSVDPGEPVDPEALPAFELKSYEGLRKDARIVSNVLEAHGVKCGFVGVAVEPGVLLPSMLIGIMQAGCGFYPMECRKPFSDSFLSREILQIDWIIAQKQYCLASGIESKTKNAHEIMPGIYLIRLQDYLPSYEKVLPRFKYAYAMRTSGTTGNRRVVLVPHTAIVINLLDLIHEFEISGKDRILALAPSTFDPSVVDLFLGLIAGATIVYVDDSIKLCPAKLAEVVIEERITVMQSTPSFLKRFDLTMLLIFGRSSLRVLALGGEKCLSKEFLREIVTSKSSLELFNIYGITEVSCWASVERIVLDDDNAIPVGQPLSLIQLTSLAGSIDAENEGELLIGYKKSRACVVYSEKYGTIIEPFMLPDENHYRYFQTGDLVNCGDSDTVQNYYFLNRLDRIRKRNGIKVDLEALEFIALEAQIFKDAWCVDWNQEIVLILLLDLSNHDRYDLHQISTELYTHLKTHLYFDHYPDKVIYLKENPPLSQNGKLDLKSLFQQLSSSNIEVQFSTQKSFAVDYNEFQQIFRALWNFSTRRGGSDVAESDMFVYSGGNSISAMIFIEEFFNRIQKFGGQVHIENEKRLQRELLSKPYREVQSSFFKIVEMFDFKCDFAAVQNLPGVDTLKKGEDHIMRKDCCEDVHFGEFSIPPTCHSISVPVGLCVDAIPVLAKHPTHDQVCIAGSHSGSLYAFSLKELADYFQRSCTDRIVELDCGVVWKKLFPARIEVAPAIHPHYYFAYLGCHDGKLYKISVIDGEVEWAFTSEGSDIRASPTVSPDGDSVIFHTANCIYCVDANSGTIHWRQQCNSYILQTCSMAISKNLVIFATVGGIRADGLKDGLSVWQSKYDHIRTAPILVPVTGAGDCCKTYIVFGDFTGSIIALDELDGTQIWTFNVNQQTPNSLTFHNCSLSSCRNAVLLTTYKGNVFSIDPLTGEEQNQLSGLLYARSKPAVVDVGNVAGKCYCLCNSLDGKLYFGVLHHSDPSVENTFTCMMTFSQENSESFSSPVYSTKFNILAVGARDNCIHFMKLS